MNRFTLETVVPCGDGVRNEPTFSSLKRHYGSMTFVKMTDSFHI
jgi:hypothetical protein